MGCVGSKSDARPAQPDDNAWDGHVRPIKPWKIEPALTSEQLERLRSEFWETRVEGRAEMWQALHFAAEAESEVLCDETIKAAGLRPANRRNNLLTTFDERGALYEVPMYALSDPTNLNVEPCHAEFKDAARAVVEYIEARESRRARATRAL